MRNNLGRWKRKFVSMAGRFCLIKFVLSSLPLFFLSLYKMSTMVVKEFERLQRNFLCGWGLEGMKIVWTSWDKVCESKEIGGFGMIELRKFNEAHLIFDCLSSIWKEPI